MQPDSVPAPTQSGVAPAPWYCRLVDHQGSVDLSNDGDFIDTTELTVVGRYTNAPIVGEVVVIQGRRWKVTETNPIGRQKYVEVRSVAA